MKFKVEKLSKRNISKWILRDIDFLIEPGQIFGVLGEQFSGKTTLLNILSGKSKSNGGSYGFEDSGLQNLRPPKRTVAIGSSLNSKPSLLERIGVHASPDSKSDVSRIIDQIDRDAELILIDGGISVLDEDDKERLAEHLRALCSETGAVAILASRRFSDIARFCDRALIIDATHQIQSGTPKELYQEPKTVKAAIITGHVNLLSARRTSSTKVENPVFRLIDTPQDIIARPTSNADLGPINQNINLMIRPESLSISFGASFPEDNLLKGTIQAIDFRGPFTYLRLNCDGLKLTATVPKVIGLEIGNDCMIGLPPDRIHVLKS
jgi:ABC-type sugar transport system ATPase subunit